MIRAASDGTLREEPAEPGVLWWTIDHPARKNAVTPAGLAFVATRARELAGEVVLLRGAGDQIFCSGFDLHALGAAATPLPDDPLAAAAEALVAADATFVAILRGPALGAAVELAASCDFRIASPEVTFSIPAARLGVVYRSAGLRRFCAVFGVGRVRRMVLLGEAIAAAEVASAGGIDVIAPAHELDGVARDLALRIRAGAPLSVRGNRDHLRKLAAGTLDREVEALHEQARARAYASADHREGLTAAIERRAPRFGR